MTKHLIAAFAALAALSLSVNAQNVDEESEDGFSLELSDIGASTSYLWRGQELSGLNLQGALSSTWQKGDFSVSIGTWFIHAFQESIVGPFMGNGFQEWDFSADFEYKGIALTVCDYMSAPYFKRDAADNNFHHALDATLAYTISDDVPLTLSWSTILAGDDDRELLPLGGMKRFYSSYFGAAYDFNIGDLPVDFSASVGVIPWTSPYVDEVEGAHVSWLGLSGSYGVPISSNYDLPLSLTVGFNPTDVAFLWSFAVGF